MNRPNHEVTTRRRVLWIGPTHGEELGPCHDRLAENHTVLVEGTPAAGLAAINEGNGFEQTVLACPRPLVITGPVEVLRDALAQQPLVQLLGTWCEGEGRTGKIVEGVERVFWHAWPAWLSQWESNGTAESEQAIEGPTIGGPTIGGLVEIKSGDAEFAKSLIDTLADIAPAIWSPSWYQSVSTPPAVILWDGSQLGGREADELYGICQSASKTGAAVAAMLDFPRPETVAAARDIGVAAVLGKPFSIELLREALAASLQTSRPTHHAELVAEPISEAPPEPTSLREQLQAEREQLASEAA